ncbi:MAG: hypothetical protein ACI9MC_002765 [Kiritimatiellia bacterium]|jgi:hypothetical protein
MDVRVEPMLPDQSWSGRTMVFISGLTQVHLHGALYEQGQRWVGDFLLMLGSCGLCDLTLPFSLDGLNHTVAARTIRLSTRSFVALALQFC